MRLFLKPIFTLICILLLAGCSQKEPPIFELIRLTQEAKHDEVTALGEKLISENPDNTQAHRFLIKSAFAKGEGEKCGKKYEELAQANPDVAGYRFALGYSLSQTADLDDAMVQLQKAVELNPNLEYAHYIIGWIYFNADYSGKDAEKALAEWDKEEQLNPRSLGALQVYADRADYYLRVGDPNNAIRDYEKVAMYGFARDDIKDARELISRIRALRDELARLEVEARNNPDDAGILFELGRMQYQNAMLDEAIESWSKACELDPENAELRNYMGKGLLESGRHAEATEQLRKVVELDPTLATAYYNLAVAEDFLGRAAEAAEHYAKYLELNPMAPKANEVKQRIGELQGEPARKEQG